MKLKEYEQPHCDMFSLPEACPECGNEVNETAGICDSCGCRWDVIDGVKKVTKHGRMVGKH